MRRNSHSLWILTQSKSEVTTLSEAKQRERVDQIQETHHPEGLTRLRGLLDDFVAGGRPLKALEFYYHLECCSPLASGSRPGS